MAWTEDVSRRRRNSRTYVDGPRRLWSGRLVPLHYESILDSGIFDAEVNATPEHVTAGGNDIWRITSNGWHYAVGQPSDKTTDGWVGFGGRQGSHWLRFRLLRLGYLHWPTRAWEDVGGAPSYARAELSSSPRQIPVGPDVLTPIVVASWRNIWNTPGNGEASLRWVVSGDGLKEDVIVNAAARTWVAANHPPSTPASETWFGAVFAVDVSDIPKWVIKSIEQNPEGDFSDDLGRIEMRDALDHLIGFMPISAVHVFAGMEGSEVRLRKRLWKDPDGNHYLLVGARCDHLAAMPPGDLVFDPSIPQHDIDANADDATQEDTTEILINNATIWMGFFNHERRGGFRWQTLDISQGADVSSAIMQLYYSALTGTITDVHMKVVGDDVDDAVEWSTSSDLWDITPTTAQVDWDPTAWSSGYYSLPDISSIIEELVGRGGWVADNDIRLAIIDDGTAAATALGAKDWMAWEEGLNTALLDVMYTAGSIAKLSDGYWPDRYFSVWWPVDYFQEEVSGITAADITETVAAGDAQTAALITAAARAEVASAIEASAGALITSAARAEAATAADALDASRIYVAAASEAAAAAETPTATQIRAAASTEALNAAEASDRALVAAAAKVEAASAADAPAGTKVGVAAITEPAAATETPGATRDATASLMDEATAVDSPVASLISSAAVVEAVQASDQQSTGTMPKDASIVEAANASDTADAVLAGAPPTRSPSRQQTAQVYEDPGSYARLMEENKRRALELWAELFRGVLHLSEEDARLRAVAQLEFEQERIEEEELVMLL